MGNRKNIGIYIAASIFVFALLFTSCGKNVDTEKGAPESRGIQSKEEFTVEEVRKEVMKQKTSVWKEKKVSICGDSISTFTGYIPDYYSKYYPENGAITDVNDTWWMQVINRTGMELCRNASYSGSTVSGQSQDNHDGRYSCGDKRIADLASEDGTRPDVIIVLMGANDLLNNISLGSYDGVSAVEEGNIETFSEAYALMLDKMKAWYPDAEIYCSTIAEVSRWNDVGEKFPFVNAHGTTAGDYNAWITSIAQKKEVKLIDVYNCGITYENAQEYTSDGTHPNVEGAKLIADKIMEVFS
ncbi:MAG: SGNH/GDSL hydrolase family protein [Clostridiales bacterium]|nr:SGNH/GDSL hydrolase family protein [Clostridiales bacterium]